VLRKPHQLPYFDGENLQMEGHYRASPVASLPAVFKTASSRLRISICC